MNKTNQNTNPNQGNHWKDSTQWDHSTIQPFSRAAVQSFNAIFRRLPATMAKDHLLLPIRNCFCIHFQTILDNGNRNQQHPPIDIYLANNILHSNDIDLANNIQRSTLIWPIVFLIAIFLTLNQFTVFVVFLFYHFTTLQIVSFYLVL